MAGRIGKACGKRYGNPLRYSERHGWNKRQALQAARQTIARNLLRVFYNEPSKCPNVLSNWLSNSSLDTYDRYERLFERADREMVKAYHAERLRSATL